MREALEDLLKYPPVLFYGIGNVGRQDDGLGIRFIESLEALIDETSRTGGVSPEKQERLQSISLRSNYQLNVEDALDIAKFETVVFVDATAEELPASTPFQWRSVEPSSDIAFSTHAMSMESILALTEQFYHKKPRAFLLAIPGFQWDIDDQLSPSAQTRLDLALKEIRPCLQKLMV